MILSDISEAAEFITPLRGGVFYSYANLSGFVKAAKNIRGIELDIYFY
jgi:hypothetical protein